MSERSARTHRIVLVCLSLAVVAAGEDTTFTITADHADGIYKPGERVVWTIVSTRPPPAGSLAYSVKAGGRTQVATGTLSFAERSATVSTAFDQPGTLLLTVMVDDKTTLLCGAACAWEAIRPSAPEPADFDAFWKAKLGELAAVPMEPVLEEVAAEEPGVQMWKLTMGNIRGSQIHGYLARPAGAKPCPAMLELQFAGVYPLQRKWVTERAKYGWLVLDISAHDLPIDREQAFYDRLTNGALKGYGRIGNADRETSYFLRMYMACYRAADYLATRPDWDRTTLLAQGGSQGGLQAVVAAGLHPAITCLTANVPAGCDHTGPLIGRDGGWPKWLDGVPAAELDAKSRAAAYYDTVNFAGRVHCPALIATGLIDTTCPPAGVFAMFNRLAGPKRMLITPAAGHAGPSDAYYRASNTWWVAAAKGQPLPMQ